MSSFCESYIDTAVCACSNSCVEKQLAGSVRYGHGTCWINEIRPGLFALWNRDGNLLLITEDWNEVLSSYRVRPPLPVRAPAPSRHGLDLTQLEILI